MGADTGQDVIRRAELAAIPAGEKKRLYLALVGLAGQHGVACGALPARAPGRSVQAGQHHERTVPQTAHAPQVGRSAFQQPAHIRPCAAAVPALPHADAVAPARALIVVARHVEAHDAPVGKACVAQRTLPPPAAARFGKIHTVHRTHIHPVRALPRAAALHGAIRNRHARRLGKFQPGRDEIRIFSFQRFVERNTDGTVSVGKRRHPGHKPGPFFRRINELLLKVPAPGDAVGQTRHLSHSPFARLCAPHFFGGRRHRTAPAASSICSSRLTPTRALTTPGCASAQRSACCVIVTPSAAASAAQRSITS